ncbi:MAG: hypothetical protein D6768_19405 [Chloroflexi bacterium]|nr:MAG: hypothetical protein D6768_19405 [Chloroflexota bacterium]
MSGLLGVCAPNTETNIENQLRNMAATVMHRPWYVTETYAAPNRQWGFGRVGIGIFNQASQPAWNSNRTVAVMLAGEFYNQYGLQKFDIDATLPDEHIALNLYQKLGDDFVCHLKGAFVVAIWDRSRDSIILYNDRFGLYNTFYAARDGYFIFGPEMKAVLCSPAIPRSPDMVALAQYMRFQHLLGDRTFFEDVKLMPPASVLTCRVSTARVQIRPYWAFADIPHHPNISFNEAVEETGRLLSRAVKRLSGDNYRPGVYLSGGLDSRTIAGFVEPSRLTTLTYGQKNCRDVYFAQKIADTLGSRHIWVDMPNGKWVADYADFHLSLTEGFHSWIHAHGISTLEQARQVMDVNLTGWGGGTVMGHPDSIEPLQMHAVDEQALTVRLFYLFNQKYTWPSITEAEEQYLYTDSLAPQLQGLAFDSFKAELAPYWDIRPDVRAEYFTMRNHDLRLTHNLVTFYRSHIEMRFPFFDYDLFDFLYGIPANHRADKKLYRAVLQKYLPRLAYVPYNHNLYLPTTKAIFHESHKFWVRLTNRVGNQLHLRQHALHTLYADYENYLRTDLKAWAENILFDPQTLGRGIFNPAYIKSVWNRHQSGLEEWTIGKIAPLITYEMMLRRFGGDLTSHTEPEDPRLCLTGLPVA